MKNSLLAGLMLLGSMTSLHAQTVTFKPGPATGQDAPMWMLDGACIPYGYTQTPADVNYGLNQEFSYSAWTWYAGGCSTGYNRSVIRFDDLASIPSSATIISAQLNLYGIPPNPNYWGNNYFPGTPLPNTNEGELYQADYTQPQWYQNSVTWNTQPGVMGSPVIIPYSTAQWNWNTSADVTSMVQDMVSNPSHNHGFLMKLQNETYYRGVTFATCENSDPNLWPELVITYCDAGFGYTVNNGAPYYYHFNANTTTAVDYNWYIDGSWVGNGSSFDYFFSAGAGSHDVCLVVKSDDKHECKECMKICIADNGKPVEPPKNKIAAGENKTVRSTAKVLAMDNVNFGITKISPNPGHKGWTVSMNASKEGNAEITIYDITGRKIQGHTQKLVKGDNEIYQSADGLANGTYLIEINGNGYSVREKLMRN